VSDKFTPIPIEKLLPLVLSEIHKNRFFSIPGSLFFVPQLSDPFRITRYGSLLETPLGVAAGPHSQLALNIIASWLCGARYIELKTVQTLDELEVSKPCIDMQDEGYNCEWSQELKIHQSFNEYLNAWIIVHILHKELGHPGIPGTLFNMSVGYNMDGILTDNVQWFLQKMTDCSAEIEQAKQSVSRFYPQIHSIEIPASISNHVTLSTMHGCPPEEIEKIGLYLIREKSLHTTIKLNPTLLGPEKLRNILNDRLRFATEVPDLAFDHDLKYTDALQMISMLKETSEACGLQFSVKLTNTLESQNNKHIFSEKESMMYMSGRALHPISINLAHKLSSDFRGKLDISFSAGVDCFNIAETLACGLRPVTVCSDLLKPGGYGRLWQYIKNLRESFNYFGATTFENYIQMVAGHNGISSEQGALYNLQKYSDKVLQDSAYRRSSYIDPDIKTNRELGYFDCIHPPCADTCPTHQDIPGYMYFTANGKDEQAFQTIFRTNPFPSVTGMICDHPCQSKCTRINYDEALNIREIKRYIAETIDHVAEPPLLKSNGKTAAIIGAGPAGLSCAWFLRNAGFEVNVYEQGKDPGGMVSSAIPEFRLTELAVEKDIQRIIRSSVNLHSGYKITRDNFENLRMHHDVVFLAAGAQKTAELNIEGIQSKGVLDVLDFLFDAKQKRNSLDGKHVIIIGGGNTAMDAARTAYRLVGKDGKVTIVYRRTIKEMPADKGEIKAVIEEGITIMELVNPERIVSSLEADNLELECSRNILAMKGKDGRPLPVKIPDSEFLLHGQIIIPAIGQKLDIDFLPEENLNTVKGSYKTRVPGIYIGGDAMRGASTAINAIADGRLAAAEIISDFGGNHEFVARSCQKEVDYSKLLHNKSLRKSGIRQRETDVNDRRNFQLVSYSFSKQEAQEEASRCLLCDEICNVCVSVCPNLANYTFEIKPVRFELQKILVNSDGSFQIVADKIFAVDQKFQILNISDLCNECGNCTTFCPSSGSPYKDKPRLCLTIESFNNETEAYYLSRLAGKDVLIYKHHESIRTLTCSKNEFIYETDQVRLSFDPDYFTIRSVEIITPCVREVRTEVAAEMSIIMKGALQLTL
jgi:putative selenate reductase